MRRNPTNAILGRILGILVCVVALAVTSLPMGRVGRPGLSRNPIEARRVVRRSPLDSSESGPPRMSNAALAQEFRAAAMGPASVLPAPAAETLPAIKIFRFLKRIRTGGPSATDPPLFS